MIEAATAEAPSDQGVKRIVAILTAAITIAGGAMVSPDYPVMLAIAAIIVVGVALALFVDGRIGELKQTVSQQGRELVGCRGEHQKCRDDLHARDVLLAMFYVHIAHGSERRGNERRKATRFPSELELAFERTIGSERAPGILDEARKLLASAASGKL